MKIIDVVFVYQLKSDREIDWHGRNHCHGDQEYEFHYFLQGDGVFFYGSQGYTIKKGTLFLCLPGTRHQIRAANTKRPISYYAVLFSLCEGDYELKEQLNQDYTPIFGASIGTSYRFFFEQIKERGMSPHANLRKSAEYQLLSFMYSQASESDPGHYSDEGNYHIEKALRMMQNMVFGHISLNDLALHLGLDPSYFVRLFRRKMHISPMKYYTKLKVEAASSLLINTDAPIYEISERLCFSSEFHLSKLFKHYTGYAPSHYRTLYAQHLV